MHWQYKPRILDLTSAVEHLDTWLRPAQRKQYILLEVCNALSLIYSSARLALPLADPFVKAKLEGLQWSVAKPVIKKAYSIACLITRSFSAMVVVANAIVLFRWARMAVSLAGMVVSSPKVILMPGSISGKLSVSSSSNFLCKRKSARKYSSNKNYISRYGYLLFHSHYYGVTKTHWNTLRQLGHWDNRDTLKVANKHTQAQITQ